MAQIYLKLNQIKNAIELMEEIIKINKEINVTNAGYLHFELGCILLQNNQKVRALNSFKTALLIAQSMKNMDLIKQVKTTIDSIKQSQWTKIRTALKKKMFNTMQAKNKIPSPTVSLKSKKNSDETGNI